MSQDKEEAKKHFVALKKSSLYDKELKMFKVCSSLEKESNEVGRSRVFLPGWLENESVFMHMEFKYLLGLLKAGLYEEFFSSIKTCFPCFLKPEIYGRSILENSSFISSSAFPDKRNWGRGFVARLSGSTAEFIDMWLTMILGYKPFYVNENNELVFSLKPIINGEFFDKKGEFKTKLFSATDLVYMNKSKKSTYLSNMNIKKIEILWNDGSKETIEKDVIIGKSAEKIRARLAKQIVVTF
jgi:cellobiose phosphorylase